MDIEKLAKKLKQANALAVEALESTDNTHEALWEKAGKVESSIQTGLDFEVEGLVVEWSTAYSQYIIRAEKE